MAINDNTRGMIDALAKGDIAKSKAYAKCILANDKAEKNRRWKDHVAILLDSGGENQLELPANLYSICELMRPGSDFRPDMYYLPKAEAPIAEEIKRKQEVVRRMQVLGVPASNTTLLYGPPGTGKTELAKYVAYKLNKPLLILRFSNLINSYMGETGKNIGKVFDFFNQNDIILFLDELDTVACRREGGSGCDGEISRTTACIMQELDRLSGGGIIIAATNRRDLLDEALLRRFALHHEVRCVDEEERGKMVHAFWQAVGIAEPFEVSDYVKHEYTPSRIHTDMIKYLAKYLEEHPEQTRLETAVKNEIVIPSHWAELFLLAAEKLAMTDKICGEMEKETYSIARIAADIPIPKEAEIKYGSDAKICFDERADAVRYSIYLCRTAYRQYFNTDKQITMGELAAWVKKYVSE